MALRRLLLASALLALALLSTLTIPSVAPGPAEASNVTQIAAGDNHACALLSAGTVKCWGSNSSGQLGDGTTTTRYTPVDVCATGATPPCNAGNSNILTGVTAITAGSDHTCALITGGGVKCWGYNGEGDLGDGTTTDRHTPVVVCGDPGCGSTLGSVISIAAGAFHTCALISGGTVKCWGMNSNGQLGIDDNLGPETCGSDACSKTPVYVFGDCSDGCSNLTSVASVVGGGYHTCAVISGGTVKCWGRNDLGQVGDGTTTERDLPVNVQANSMTSPDTGGSVGEPNSLALDGSGDPVVSYLDSTNGSLKVLHCGNATCTAGNSLTSPDTGSVGDFSSLALDASGHPVISYLDYTNFDLKVMHCNDPDCAGGDESITSPDMTGLVGFTTSLALDASGHPVVSYWDVTNADLKVLHCGNADCSGEQISYSPDTVGSVGVYTSLALDASGHPVVSYYDSTNGDLKLLHCSNADCSGAQTSYSPDTGNDVGQYTSLRLDASGYPVVSYYDSTNGDLRVLHCSNTDCSGVQTTPPTSPDTTDNVGQSTSLRLDASGHPVISYLDVTYSDLIVLHCGDANCSAGNTTAYPNADSHGSGLTTSLALDASGSPVVAYYDSTNADLKVLHCGLADCADDLSGVTFVGAGAAHTCAVVAGGRVKCWGANGSGQLGEGTTYDSDTPINVCANSTCSALLSGVQSVAAGTSHTCAVVLSGRAKCWGQNADGELGDGTNVDSDTPRDVCKGMPDGTWAPTPAPGPGCDTLATGFSSGDLGAYFGCFATTVGNVRCWGDNSYGELGTAASMPDSNTPSNVYYQLSIKVGVTTITSPDTVGNVGQYTSLVFDSSGNPVVSYYDATNGDVKLLRCGNPACASGNTISSPDTTGNVGQYTTVGFDPDGNPGLTYYDATNGDQKAIACSNASCSSQTFVGPVAITGDVGQFGSGSSLVGVHLSLAFYDATNGDLGFFHCTPVDVPTCGGSATLVSPDTGGVGDVGRYTSTVLDSSGNAVISYYDVTNGDLKVLHCGNPACSSGNSVTTVDAAGNVGYDTSIKLDVGGNPVVSYWDVTNAALKVLHCGNATCTAGNVITAPYVAGAGGSGGTSLALDASGKPVVAFWNGGTFGFLRILHCGDANCTSGNTLGEPDTGSGANVGFYPSMKLDVVGNPVVAYYDSTNNDLKILHCGNPNCSGTLTVPTSNITGTGVAGDSGSGVPASTAAVDDPTGLSQSSTALYFADTNNCKVKKIESGNSYTLAGVGTGGGPINCGYSGDNGPATSAKLNLPRDVFLFQGVFLLIADTENCMIRLVYGGSIYPLAGNGTCTNAIDGPGGNAADDVVDGGSPLSTSLNKPKGVAVDGSGNVYIADTENCRIRKVTGSTISTIAGTGACGFAGDGGPATAAQLNQPSDVAFLLPGDDLVIADTSSNRIRRYSMSTGSITTIAGTGTAGFSGDGGQATSAMLNGPEALTAIDNHVLIADTQNNRIRRINTLTGVIDTIVGVGGQTGSYVLSLPQGVAVVAGGGGGGAGAAAGQGEAAGPGGSVLDTTFANSGANKIGVAGGSAANDNRGSFRPTTSCSVTPHVSSIDFAILPVMLGLIGFRRRLRVLFITLRSMLTPKRRPAAPVPTL